MGREADARLKLAAALANNLDLRDRFGRPVMEGGGYTVNFLQAPVYSVEKIAAALDRPDLPSGTFRVSLVSHITLLLMNGQPTEELALCAMPRTAAPPAEPPPDEDPAPPADTDQPPALPVEENSDAPRT